MSNENAPSKKSPAAKGPLIGGKRFEALTPADVKRLSRRDHMRYMREVFLRVAFKRSAWPREEGQCPSATEHSE